MSAYTEQVLVDKLSRLSNSQQSIQTLSHWIMYHRKRVKTSVDIWERELYNAPVQRKLLFLYLANDIVQTSRKKGIEFIKEFARVMGNAVVHTYNAVDQASKNSIVRMLDIWFERRVYEQKLIDDIKVAIGKPRSSSQPATQTASPAAPPAQFVPPASLSTYALPIVENKYITAFTELEQASVRDRLMAEKVNLIRPSLFSGELLPQLKDQEELQGLAAELEDATATLQQYEKSLQEDLHRREEFSSLLTNLLAQQEQAMNEATEHLHFCRERQQQAEQIKEKMMELCRNLPPGVKRDTKKGSSLHPGLPLAGNGANSTGLYNPLLPTAKPLTSNNNNHVSAPTTPPTTPPPLMGSPTTPPHESSEDSQPPHKKHKPQQAVPTTTTTTVQPLTTMTQPQPPMHPYAAGGAPPPLAYPLDPRLQAPGYPSTQPPWAHAPPPQYVPHYPQHGVPPPYMQQQPQAGRPAYT